MYRDCKLHSDVVFRATSEVYVQKEVHEFDDNGRRFVTDVVYRSKSDNAIMCRIEVRRTHTTNSLNREGCAYFEVLCDHVLQTLKNHSNTTLMCEAGPQTIACGPCKQEREEKEQEREEKEQRAREQRELEQQKRELEQQEIDQRILEQREREQKERERQLQKTAEIERMKGESILVEKLRLKARFERLDQQRKMKLEEDRQRRIKEQTEHDQKQRDVLERMRKLEEDRRRRIKEQAEHDQKQREAAQMKEQVEEQERQKKEQEMQKKRLDDELHWREDHPEQLKQRQLGMSTYNKFRDFGNAYKWTMQPWDDLDQFGDDGQPKFDIWQIKLHCQIARLGQRFTNIQAFHAEARAEAVPYNLRRSVKVGRYYVGEDGIIMHRRVSFDEKFCYLPAGRCCCQLELPT
jgi:hypothetical protein